MSVKVEVVEAYDADWRAHSQRYAHENEGDSMTVQEQLEESDINTIVRRFGLTGQMPQSLRLPEYGDYEGIFDFQSAQQVIIDAQKSFMSLPADVRNKFSNSPQLFLEFVSDPANKDEMLELGLLKKAEPVVVPAPPVEPNKA